MQPTSPANPAEFRRDINGLRAWAVVSVVLYHFGVPGFSGGFVGVDVFFVISGFLMTGIVLKGLERGDFSVMRFYVARARRILPALLALCAVLLAGGWLVLLPIDYKTLATHALASIGFLSNIKYWTEAGYFDAASHEKWLLHTWSLSLEWQFYLLLPLCMLVVWRLKPGRRAQAAFLLVVFGLSLTLSVWDSAIAPARAFFLLHTRAWELVAGGLCLFVRGPVAAPRRALLVAAGMAMIVLSIVAFDTQSVWPGLNAALPVLGTVLVLVARAESSWTGLAPAQWLGTHSYSLYLWHWPVAVALFYWELQAEAGAVLLGLVATLLLARASYRWVETTARYGTSGQRLRPVPYALIGCSAAACAVAWGIRSMDGLPHRIPAQVVAVADQSHDTNPRRDACHPHTGNRSPSCVYGGPEWRILVLGDSHASGLMTAVQQALPDAASGAVQWTYSGCAFLPGVPPRRGNPNAEYQCEGFRSWVIQELDRVPASVPVLVANRYTDLDGAPPAAGQSLLSRLLASTPTPERREQVAARIVDAACLLARSRQVYMLRPIPEYEVRVPQALARRMAWGIGHEQVAAPRSRYADEFDWVNASIDRAQARCGIVPLDPTPFLCDQERCYGSVDDSPLYHDADHLSETGNKRLVPLLRTIFEAHASR